MYLVNQLIALAGTILPFLFVLTIVVFFHELGHFLVGRWCGARVDAFSLGFGPELFGFVDRRGTRWRLAAIPLGGYVKFRGDADGASTPDREALRAMPAVERASTFAGLSVGRRAAIIVAGPLANLVLAIAIFAGLNVFVGHPSSAPRVGAVVEGGAAARAGFRPDDVVLSVEGRPVATFQAMQRIVAASAGAPLAFVLRRGEAEVALVATPDARDVAGPDGQKRIGMLGVVSSIERSGPIDAVRLGAVETWSVVSLTAQGLWGMATGHVSADQLSGPIRIAEVSGAVAKVGVAALLNLTALLSISVGVLNLAPIPLLDGGHLLYFVAEALRGRPLPEKAQEYGFRFGLVVVGALMLFATLNDLLRLVRG